MTIYFANVLHSEALRLGKRFVIAFKSTVLASFPTDIETLKSSQEEADTKMILHAVHIRNQNIDSVHICSPDTDVLVLAIRRCPLLPKTTFFLKIGQKKRFINVNEIFNKLGEKKSRHSSSSRDTQPKKTWLGANRGYFRTGAVYYAMRPSECYRNHQMCM